MTAQLAPRLLRLSWLMVIDSIQWESKMFKKRGVVCLTQRFYWSHPCQTDPRDRDAFLTLYASCPTELLKKERTIKWIRFDICLPLALTVSLNEWKQFILSCPSGAKDTANWILTEMRWHINLTLVCEWLPIVRAGLRLTVTVTLRTISIPGWEKKNDFRMSSDQANIWCRPNSEGTILLSNIYLCPDTTANQSRVLRGQF